MYNHYYDKKQNSILFKQLLRSSTAIGALVAESKFAESKLDFIHKLKIALKEANESLYWIELLFATAYLNKKEYESIAKDNNEIIKILISIIKTTKDNIKS